MGLHVICSKNHWEYGWIGKPEVLDVFIEVVRAGGLQAQWTEVESLQQLESFLDGLAADDLIMPNAYFVDDPLQGTVWLFDALRERTVNMVGSGADTLKTVLHKDRCQEQLHQYGIAIPNFTALQRENALNWLQGNDAQQLPYPQVVKATAEAQSRGIALAHNPDELDQAVNWILNSYPQSQLILETFLAGDEISCGYFAMGDNLLLLPTWHRMESVEASENIHDYEVRTKSYETGEKQHLPIKDKGVLNQLKHDLPQIAECLRIEDITRVDGRLDQEGRVRYFDVNGMTGLRAYSSEGVWQARACYPAYSMEEVYRGMVHTLVASSLIRHGQPVPAALLEHNLFTMNSDHVVKFQLDNTVSRTTSANASRVAPAIQG